MFHRSTGLRTDTLKYNWDRTHANEFPVAVEDLDVGTMRNIAEETKGICGRA
jgi:hypothetical protein